MEPSAVIIGLVALVAGLLIGVVLGRFEVANTRAELCRLQVDQSGAAAQIAQARADAAEARALAEAANAARSEARAQLSAATAERDAARQRAEELSGDRKSMVDQFKLLSSQTLQEQSRQADETAEQRLARTESLMTPVKENLQQLAERLNQVEKERATMSAELREQVTAVLNTSERLRTETSALSTALRKPQVRGSWGEMQLKRVVEVAGMLEHCDFRQQETTTTSADTTIRPDMTVLLGEGKFCYVDSKVPMTSFLDAQEAASIQEREKCMAQFARNVRSHVDGLSAKEYWKSDAGSPEFVVMFLPSEALGAEALNQAPDLNEYAAARNIIIATPSTLIGLLRSIAYGWKQATLAQSAAEVFTLGRELHDRLSTMGESFGKLGRSLASTVNAYNQTVGSLESRVLVTARRFRDLKVTEAELGAATGLTGSPRPLGAPELLADDTRAQLQELTGRTESVDELVSQQQPRIEALRELG